MPAPAGGEEQRHVVVFDVNVYLDVASLVGAPFTWEKFDARAAALAQISVPHPTDPRCDSLRALAACTSGRFAGDEPLEVWTNAHIDRLVRGKAQQPSRRDPVTGRKGLGWNSVDAQTLLDELITGMITRSSGGTLGGHYPDGNPPLDHEDGMVYGACRLLVNDDLLARVYCVTRDREFLEARRSGRIADHSLVLTPAAFIALIRSARRQLSIQQIHRPLGAGPIRTQRS